jgi:hypothetical protein
MSTFKYNEHSRDRMKNMHLLHEGAYVNNALILERPSLRNGIETAAPSGKFCNPIPKASAMAPVSISGSGLLASAPKATPTAKPSGILCRVIARTSRMLRCQVVLIPSALS